MTETIALIIALVPSISAFVGIILAGVTILHKMVSTFKEFKDSASLKENNKLQAEQIKENKELRKLVRELMIEVTKIRPAGYCDDQEKKEN